MKKIVSLILPMLASVPAWAGNDALCISHSNGISEYALLSAIDSLRFTPAADSLYVVPFDGAMTVGLPCSSIERITYLSSEEMPKTLQVVFDGATATIQNPYFLQGVTASAQGAYVTVVNVNTTEEIESVLSGTTTQGSFCYQGSYKTTLVLDGVSITSQQGPAIDIQCGKRIDLELKKNTVNTLCDAAGGTHHAALYCKGHLEIDKAGTLNVTGKTAHAISAKEYIKFKKSEAVINILGAVTDGIHCKQYLLGNGANITINNVGDDGIQVELDEDDDVTATTIFDDEYVNGTLCINDGTYNVNVSGTASNAPAAGPGGGGGWPGGGQTTSTYKALRCQGPAIINGGTLWVNTSRSGAEGLESKTSITISGGNHYFKCYDDCINSSGIINFAGGNVVCYGYGNDAIDSNYGKKGAITISGGNVFTYTTKGSPEEGFDCDNNSYIVITGGIAVSAGGSQGGGGGGWGGGSSSSQSVGSSTQGYYLGSSPSSYSTSYYYTLCNTSGTPICSYKFEANCSNILSLLTAPDLGKGTITVKSGTAKPEAATVVSNASGQEVFFIAPTVTTTSTVATVTSK